LSLPIAIAPVAIATIAAVAIASTSSHGDGGWLLLLLGGIVQIDLRKAFMFV
jgi:hypothetical protein